VFSAVPEEALLKVSAVEADIEQPELGMSSEDRQSLLQSDVSVVFHVAASVRFDAPLNTAIKTNTLSVAGMMTLCDQLPQIKVKKAEL
jgi:thioester reductase-like protein